MSETLKFFIDKSNFFINTKNLLSHSDIATVLLNLARKELSQYDCLNIAQLQLLDETIQSYAVNQMVRHGLRDQKTFVISTLHFRANFWINKQNHNIKFQRKTTLAALKH